MKVDIKNVLICDAVDGACVDLLKTNGINVEYKLKLPVDELCKEIKKYDAAIVRSDTKITAQVLEAGKGSLKVVGRAGAGVDNIDVTAATKNNVIVLNTPGGNSISACELTCVLIGALARPVAPAAQSMKEGRWDRKLYTGTELYGKTLAVLGLGRIGREVGMRMRAWGMRIIGYDPITTAQEAKLLGIEKMSLEEIWPLADFITVHTPLIPATKNLISSQTLSKCKAGVKVVNVARGGIVDEKAVLEALQSGHCGGAAFDVYEEEPPKSDISKKLINHPKVVATPHLGASTTEAQIRVAVEVAEQFIALTGKSKTYTTYPGQEMPVNIKNVLICDAVDNACVVLLKNNGINVGYKLKLPVEELCKEVKNYDAVIVRSDTKITAQVLEAGKGSLKAIGRAGAGVDNIDVAAATKNNVIVLNTPGGNSISACELTCILIGNLARPVVQAAQSMKEGRWDRKLYSGTELYGKTLAVLGLGRIGREVGMRMKAWGMRVIGYDPIVSKEECLVSGIEKMSLDDIWPLADFITVHTPLVPATKDLISFDALSKCRKGVKVINVARGGIVNEQAILEAMEKGQCGGAAFDVYPEEPPKSDLLKELISHPKIVATPHLGASTSEAQVRVAVEVAEQFIALTGKSKTYTTYLGVINREVLTHYQ
uniref:D-3-phosphoglycerate dehydrogenase n=1 Tax=Glossina brevipalpis TaxID=37001 RepID=A0A1A9W0S7_9MUSC